MKERPFAERLFTDSILACDYSFNYVHAKNVFDVTFIDIQKHFMHDMHVFLNELGSYYCEDSVFQVLLNCL